MPKTVWAILATGLFFFVLTPFVGQDHMDHMADDPVANLLLNGLAAGAGGCIIAAYIVALIICGMKGKPVFVAIGIILLFVPGMSLWPVIGAIRVAKPNSTWARRYYGPEKLEIAHARFPRVAAQGGHKGAWLITGCAVVMLLAAILLIAISGLRSSRRLNLSPAVAGSRQTASTQALRVAKGKAIPYSINVPDGWTVEREQRYDYDLLMSAENQTLCVGVVAEPKTSNTIDELVANAQEYMRSAGATILSDVASVTIDNRTWRTFRMQVRLPNGIPTMQEVFMYTGTEGTFQVVGWTATNLFERNAGRLREVTHSFKFPTTGTK